MAKLVTLSRNGYPEIEIAGEISVHDGKKVLFSVPEIPGRFPARSLLKPFQFHVSGEAIDPTDRRRTAAQLGSMSATMEQVSQLETWYRDARSQALRKRLKVTEAMPMDDENRVKIKQAGIKPSPIYHTCFSKHLSILSACERNDWDLESYLSQNHPYHAAMKADLSQRLGRDGESFEWVVDGCGLPSPVLNLNEMAKLFHDLFSKDLAPLAEIMMEFPDWVGGPGRQDTRLMQQNPGILVAKEGADGLLGISVKPNPNAPDGLGIVVKTWAGYLPVFAVLALGPVFEKFGLRFSAVAPRGQEARYEYGL